MEKSDARMLIDNTKLKLAAEKIAEGIAELTNLGLSKQQILQALELQTLAFFRGIE